MKTDPAAALHEDSMLHPLFLPYSERDLRDHFLPSERDHLAAWRKRVQDADARPSDPAFLHRDETLWTAGALLAIQRHPDHRDRWKRILARAYGERPPLEERNSWEEFLDGKLELFFEVGLSSPEEYRRWLVPRLADHNPLQPQVALGRTRGIALERHTQLDALLLNVDEGYAVHFESKVLSDISPQTRFDAFRNQLARNIDALAHPPTENGPLSVRRPERSLLALLTPEMFRQRPSSRLYGHLFHEYRTSPAALHRDLEHLDPKECGSLSRRLAWLTFEDLVNENPAACLWLPDNEDPVAKAATEAAESLEELDRKGVRVRERQLQLALADRLPNSESERKIHVPGWDPQPGAVDVLARGDNSRLEIVIETKLKADNDIYECLWDFGKLLSISSGPDSPAAYAVVGTTQSGWEQHATRELFVSGRHHLVGTIRQHLEWWDKYILGDSTGRPNAMPEWMDVRLLAKIPLRLKEEEWELRVVRVMATDTWSDFFEGRPKSLPVSTI